MVDQLTDKALLFQYGDEKMTLCVCDEDGDIDQNAPMAQARTHWLDMMCAVDRAEWEEIQRFIREDVIEGETRQVKVFFAEDTYDVKVKAESQSYIGLELFKD